MTTIRLFADDQKLRVAHDGPCVVSGSRNATVLHVQFGRGWSDYEKSAVFYTTRDDKVYEVLLDEGKCTIPHEVLSLTADLYIGVRGVSSEHQKVKPTSLVKYKIEKGAPVGDGTTVEPTPDVYQQILMRLNDLEAGTGGSVDEAEIQRMVEEYLAEHPADPGAPGEPGDDGGYYVPTVTQDEAGAAIISWEASRSDMPAVQSQEVELPAGPRGDNGSDGRSAYQYAVDGGYTGTEEEFARKLAEDVASGGGGPEIWRSIHNAELAEEVSSIYVNFFETPCKKIRIQLETLAADANSSNASIAILTDIQGGKTFHCKSESIHTVPLTTARISLISAEVSKTDEGNTLEVESTLCSANGIGNLGSSYRKTTFNDAKDIYGEKLNSTITAISIFSGSGFGIGTKIKIWGV